MIRNATTRSAQPWLRPVADLTPFYTPWISDELLMLSMILVLLSAILSISHGFTIFKFGAQTK
jgi:hypothetical protein